MKPIATILALLAVAAGCCWILFSDNDLLDMQLPFDFPAGNLVGAVLLVALSAIALVIAVPGTRSRGFAKGVFVASVAWLPVSMAMAGGMRLSYSGWIGWVWMIGTLALLLAIPVALAWAIIVASKAARRG